MNDDFFWFSYLIDDHLFECLELDGSGEDSFEGSKPSVKNRCTDQSQISSQCSCSSVVDLENLRVAVPKFDVLRCEVGE